MFITPATIALVLTACADATPTATIPGEPSFARAGAASGTHRQYGTPIPFGNGRARSYVVLNQGVPLEVGLALDERALDGLRGPMQHDPAEGGDHAHEDFDAYAVPMPAQNPTPYKFIELDWNPAGHPPEDIYTLPHFDFHFCKTYDGAVIFQEPMITREFILSKPNVEIPLPMAAQVTPAGYYPSAYSITYDAQAKEHGIALTKMNWQN